MKDTLPDPVEILLGSLGTFDHRESFSPGMFEPLKTLFHSLGYEAAAIYVADDYPDRIILASGYGDETLFPPHIVLNQEKSLYDASALALKHVPNLMLGRLFSHERELGVIAVTCKNAASRRAREAFELLTHAISVMAYVERIRTNICRERQERDLFFAQSLTSRMLPRAFPKMKNLRLGYEFVRSLEPGGDFCDLIPESNGNLLGMVGTCSGTGLRTVMETTSIMREIYRLLHSTDSLSKILFRINTLLVEEKHRAHQASVCLFHVDVTARKLRVAKSGRMAALLCGPEGDMVNLSPVGATFLGMVPEPDVHDDEYDFAPGQSFLCVTEGIYSCTNSLNAGTHPYWFLESVQAVLDPRRRRPLANAAFDLIQAGGDLAKADNSILALSVEFTGRNRESLRVRR